MNDIQKDTGSLSFLAKCFPNGAWHIDEDGNYWETRNGKWINLGKGLPKGQGKEIEECNPLIDPRNIV